MVATTDSQVTPQNNGGRRSAEPRCGGRASAGLNAITRRSARHGALLLNADQTPTGGSCGPESAWGLRLVRTTVPQGERWVPGAEPRKARRDAEHAPGEGKRILLDAYYLAPTGSVRTGRGRATGSSDAARGTVGAGQRSRGAAGAPSRLNALTRRSARHGAAASRRGPGAHRRQLWT